jgi:hypothetical protein
MATSRVFHMRTTHQRPRKRTGHETQRVDRTARPRGSRSWPQAPRLSAIALRWLLGPRLKSCPQGQLKHRRYSLSGALANSQTCFPRSTAIAPCPLTDQRHTAGLARPGDAHRGAGRRRPPDLPADRDRSPRATGVDAPGRRSAQTGLAPGWPAGLATLNCHALGGRKSPDTAALTPLPSCRWTPPGATALTQRIAAMTSRSTPQRCAQPTSQLSDDPALTPPRAQATDA